MKPKECYEAGCPARQPYLLRADANARLTLPHLNPYGNQYTSAYTPKHQPDGSVSYVPGSGRVQTHPYTTTGTLAVTGLASAMVSLAFPINFQWFEIEIAPNAPVISEDPKITVGLSWIQKRIMRSMLDHQLQPQAIEVINRVLVEGNVLVIKHPFGDIRHVPLRSFIVKRFNSKIEYLVYKEALPNRDKPSEPIDLFTMVDFREGKVYQQEGDKDVVELKDAKPYHYIVVTSAAACEGDDYAEAYVSRYHGNLSSINDLTRDMLFAAHIASKANPLVNKGCGLTADDINNLEPGQGVMVDMGEGEPVRWLSAAQKLNEWAWVYQFMEVEKQAINKAFALGLASAPELNRDRQTAESVRRIAQELDSNVGALAQVLQVTFQKPLAAAYLMDELEMLRRRTFAETGQRIETPDLGFLEEFTPIVTSGPSAISKLNQLERLMQWIELFAQDPQVMNSLDRPALFKHGAQVMGISLDGFMKPAPSSPQLGQGQAGMAA